MIAFKKPLLKESETAFAQTVMLRNGLGQPIIFGMNWTAIVGGQAHRLARKRARLLRATHYLFTGAPASTVGCVQLDKQYFAQSGRIYSAAALFSTTYPVAAVACLVPFEEGGCWMVAAHAGAILSQTDRWFADVTAAQLAVEQLRIRFPNLQVHQCVTASANALPAWVNESCAEHTRLLTNQSARVGVGVRVLLVLCLVLAIVFGTWLFKRPAHELTVVDQSPTQRWLESLNNHAMQLSVHSFSSLTRLLNDWRRTPFGPNGWQLLRVQCEPVSFEWSCAAQYRRKHRFALNEHLEAVKPADWTLRSIELDRAALTWVVAQAATPLELTRLAVPIDWMTALQRLTPLFEHIQIGIPSQIHIAAPLDGQGMPIARPNGLPTLQKRSLSVKGPLRSVTAFQHFPMPIRWRSATLDVGVVSGQDLSRSLLVVQLIGEMYEYGSE